MARTSDAKDAEIMRQPKEIEYAFLGCIFDNPALRIPEALEVKTNSDWFSDQTCRLVWGAIESLRKKTQVEKIKPLVIIEEAVKISHRKKSPHYGIKITPSFIDEAKRFRDAAEEGENTTIEAYAPILQEAAIGRKLDIAMEGVRAEGKFSSNAARMMELAKQIQQIQKDESPDTGVDISDLIDNMNASYDKAYEEFAVKHNYNYIPGIPYPWDCISHMTKGLTPGLHIVAARPSVGKTSYVMQCVNFWCDLGYKVAFDCLDMAVTELIKRPIANLAWVSPKRMELGWASPEEQYRNREAGERVREWGNKGLLTWTVEFDVDKLKAWAETRRRAGKLDILIVDFAQRFRLKGASTEYEISTYVSGVLKQLANECLIPVILLSQLSRDNVKDPKGARPPELSDLRGSGALEQDATTVVLLHKEYDIINAWKKDPPFYFMDETGWEGDVRLQRERESSLAAVYWNLAKNQNGETADMPFVVFQNCFKWFVGDKSQEKSQMYQKIQADWRFLEQPFVSIEKKGATVYPSFWEQKCAEMCGKRGVPIPDEIKEKLSKWDLDRYNQLLKENAERVNDAINVSTITFEEERVTPSVVDITEKAPPTFSVPNDNHTPISPSAATLDSQLTRIEVEFDEPTDIGEPSFEDEFEDEDF